MSIPRGTGFGRRTKAGSPPVRADPDDDVHHPPLLRVFIAASAASRCTGTGRRRWTCSSTPRRSRPGSMVGTLPRGGRRFRDLMIFQAGGEFLLQPRRAERLGQRDPRSVRADELPPARPDHGTAFLVFSRPLDAGRRAHEKPRAVFVLPVATLIVCSLLLWTWAPSWLESALDKLLQLLSPPISLAERDPRKIDRGVSSTTSAPCPTPTFSG